MSGYEGFSLLAIKISANGDVSQSDSVVWSRKNGTPYIPSPVLLDGSLYFTASNRNVMTCVDSKTGKEIISPTRLPWASNVYSSPIAAGDRIYFTSRNGKTVRYQKGVQTGGVGEESIERYVRCISSHGRRSAVSSRPKIALLPLFIIKRVVSH